MHGHDGHFLSRLDRVAHDQVSFALSLYRDHEAVRFLLDRVDLDARTARVALAIGDEKKGPFVVVARDGHFVTCLGEGMLVGRLPVVGRARIDALLQKHRDQKHRDSVRDLEQHDGESDLEFFKRLVQSGDALTREQFIAYSAVQSLIAAKLINLAIEDQVWMLGQVRPLRGLSRLRSSHAKLARRFEEVRWFIGHALLLGTMGEPEVLAPYRNALRKVDVRFNACAFGLCSTTIALRAVWAAQRLGECLLPPYSVEAETVATGADILETAVTVAAIGLFDSRARPECVRILHALQKPLGQDATLDEIRHEQGQRALLLFDEEALAAKLAIDRGREIFLNITRHLPEGHPIRYEVAADVPDDVARTALLENDANPYRIGGQVSLFLGLALLRDARAEDFYFPREICSRVIFETQDDEILDYVRRFDDVYVRHGESARSQKIGRNDPCPCASGKKYKRCCGAK